MGNMISYNKRAITYDGCPGCAFAGHKFHLDCGLAYENERFTLSQDWELPIPGFLIVSPKRHIEMLSELTDEERNEMFSIADKAVRIMRENHICERFDYIFEEKENRHLHVWILPRYAWMTECADDIVSNLGAIFDYALDHFRNEDKYREIERITEIVKNGFKSEAHMKYKIISGCYESGTEEQQIGYRQLFGENVQTRFDLYFHWYNLIHELGHCVVEQYGKQMPKVKEEMFVNEFAVGYYRYAGESEKLNELRDILQSIINQMPSPVPEGETFLSFYERIWNTDEIMQVMIYGYFQLNSVLEAMKADRGLTEVAAEFGATLKPSEIRTCAEPVSSAGAKAFLETAVTNLKALGLNIPEIQLELTDNPLIQCAQSEAE